ncbi:MAG TPA: hypothetical protein VMI72_11660 [Roseiarcus sp.]|nr:hypothetical protein [Roseiarcus sp.]
MRNLPSNGRKPVTPAQVLWEFDAPSNEPSLVTFGVLGRLAVLLVIAFGFAAAAQLLVNSPF